MRSAAPMIEFGDAPLRGPMTSRNMRYGSGRCLGSHSHDGGRESARLAAPRYRSSTVPQARPKITESLVMEAAFVLVIWGVLVVVGIAINIWIGIYVVRKGVEAGIMRATANLVEIGVIPVSEDHQSTV